uniref:Pentacotripeptide-repeat region of PRORP domain-containing protein n=1 Tax=Chaetoceros debilis TaxID=122233 RepID=A0A7S3Q1M9_9STRA
MRIIFISSVLILLFQKIHPIYSFASLGGRNPVAIKEKTSTAPISTPNKQEIKVQHPPTNKKKHKNGINGKRRNNTTANENRPSLSQHAKTNHKRSSHTQTLHSQPQPQPQPQTHKLNNHNNNNSNSTKINARNGISRKKHHNSNNGTPIHRPKRKINGNGQNKGKSKNKNKHQLNTQGPYHDLSTSKLKIKTMSLLQSFDVGEMTAGQAHECGKLIIAWSKRVKQGRSRNRISKNSIETTSRSRSHHHHPNKKSSAKYVAYAAHQAGDMADRLLRRLLQEKEAGNDHAKPSVNLYNSAMNAWTKCGDEAGAQRSLDLLMLMQSNMMISAQNNSTDSNGMDTGMDDLKMKMDIKNYDRIRIIDSNRKKAIEKELKSSEKLDQIGQDVNQRKIPHHKESIHLAKCYLTAVNGCCKVKTIKSVDIATHILLEQMEELQHNGGRETRHFNAVLNAYASMYDHKSVLSLFQRMKELYLGGEVNIKPNSISYNIVIKALSGERRMSCVSKAENVLQEMEDAFYNGDKDMTPDKISYTSTLAAWARFCSKQALEKAELYLGRMIEMYGKGNTKVKPDTVTYNTVLNIIANGKSIDAGTRSLKILENMEKLFEFGDEDVKPNIVSYNAVMKAFSVNVIDDGARQALAILEKLEKDQTLTPDIISYNTVLNAFVKAKDPMSAQALLEKMEESYAEGYHVRPDTYSYNTVISAWAFSGHKRAAEIAERIFDRMETSQIRLDTTTFNTLLSAWGLQNDPLAAERATDILNHMFVVKKSGQYDVTPSAQSYGIVINAWAKSNCPRKAYRAKRLLNEMKDKSRLARSASNDPNGHGKHLQPNSYIYSSVLNACAFTSGTYGVKGEALTIAIETFRECTKRNDVVYGSFIKSCHKLMDHDDARRIPIIEKAFSQCVGDGQVSDFVLLELHSCLEYFPQVYENLLRCDWKWDNDPLTTKDLPRYWSRNVSTR